MLQPLNNHKRQVASSMLTARNVVRTYSSTTPEQWEDFSNRNILDADMQRQNSLALRSVVDGILQSTYIDMRRQKEITDVALADRIAETRDAKEKLEGHLAKVITRSTGVANIIL
jgi:tektin-1